MRSKGGTPKKGGGKNFTFHHRGRRKTTGRRRNSGRGAIIRQLSAQNPTILQFKLTWARKIQHPHQATCDNSQEQTDPGWADWQAGERKRVGEKKNGRKERGGGKKGRTKHFANNNQKPYRPKEESRAKRKKSKTRSS